MMDYHGYSTEDYRNAPSGIGPLAAEWKDKPHRLVYDLCKRINDAAPRQAERGEGGQAIARVRAHIQWLSDKGQAMMADGDPKGSQWVTEARQLTDALDDIRAALAGKGGGQVSKCDHATVSLPGAARQTCLICGENVPYATPPQPTSEDEALIARLTNPSLQCSKGQRGDIHLEAAARLRELARERDAKADYAERMDALAEERLSSLAASRAEVEALREIVRREFVTHGSNDDNVASHCYLCERAWHPEDDERHAANCLAAKP